jgi:hypothetical protein
MQQLAQFYQLILIEKKSQMQCIKILHYNLLAFTNTPCTIPLSIHTVASGHTELLHTQIGMVARSDKPKFLHPSGYGLSSRSTGPALLYLRTP